METEPIARARALVPNLRARRASHDANRRLDAEVVDELRGAGLLGLLVPRTLGGEEVTPATYVDVLDTLATGDAATAWCTMTATTSSLMLAYLPEASARAIWAERPFLAGVFAPNGRLEGGRLTGRWPWTSGSRHAGWFAMGALRDKRHVVCVVPAKATAIIDNWDTLGLAGTGSHDLAIDDAPVADEHVTSVFERAPWPDGALYRVPIFGLLAIGVAACGLGIARAALGGVAAGLAADAPAGLVVRYGELRADLDGAHAYLHAVADRAYAQPGTATRGELRLAACKVARVAADVVRGAFGMCGGAAVRAGHPAGAALRDIETLLTHRMISDRVLPAAARAVLELGPPAPDL